MTHPAAAGMTEAVQGAQPALAAAIDAVLPQTQCTRCGYPACRPYAEAIAAGTAGINQCPPGGAAGIAVLARLTGRPALPLNPANGVETPLELALIDEAHCIGCTLCIQACPTDAIVGAAKLMHTVIADRCTGCGLCLPPCPVDCISMVPAGFDWDRAHAERARGHYTARRARLARDEAEARAREAARAAEAGDAAAARKQAIIAAALAKARAQRTGATKP